MKAMYSIMKDYIFQYLAIRINPLSLAEMAGEVMSQYTDPNEAITFIERVSPKVVDHQEARVLCNVLKAQVSVTPYRFVYMDFHTLFICAFFMGNNPIYCFHEICVW